MHIRRLTSWALASALGAVALPSSCTCEEELRALPGTVVGTLCNPEDGQPMPNHAVTLETLEGPRDATTNLFGRYEVNQVPAGPVTIRATVDGQERVFEVTVASGELVELEDEECRAPPPPPPEPTGTVSGCACDDEDGAWIEGANVFIVPPSGNIVVTGTDASGCFLLENVPVGTHTLKIEKGSFYEEHTVEVVEAQDTPIETPDTCEAPPPPPPEETGTITGRVCAPDGTTWLAGALVWVVLPDGSRVQTTTDGEGRYTLTDAPAGQQMLHIEKGSFYTTIPVDVPADGTLTLPEEECAIEQDVQIAVISGTWDDVRSVLVNVGIDETLITDYSGDWAAQLLSNYDQLAQYDIVFFNCGLAELDFAADVASGGVMRDNLQQFVQSGGSIYASDQAYDIVEKTFPDFIDFYGDDTQTGAAERGVQTDSISATITDAFLAQSLGTTSIELHYPLAAWAVIQSVAAQVEVYIQGPASHYTNCNLFGCSGETSLGVVPHTVGFQVGEGKVLYTSFHQEPGINVQMETVLQLLVFEL